MNDWKKEWIKDEWAKERMNNGRINDWKKEWIKDEWAERKNE